MGRPGHAAAAAGAPVSAAAPLKPYPGDLPHGPLQPSPHHLPFPFTPTDAVKRPSPSSSSAVAAPVRRPGGVPHGLLPPHLRNPPFGPPQWGPLPPHPVHNYVPPTPKQDIFVTDMELRDEIFEIRENLIVLSLNQVNQGLHRYWNSPTPMSFHDQELFIHELEREQSWANTAITALHEDLLKEKKRRIHMRQSLARQMVPLVSIRHALEPYELRIHHLKLQIEHDRQVQLKMRKRREFLQKKLQLLAIEIEKLCVEAQGVQKQFVV